MQNLPKEFVLEMERLWELYRPPGRLADFLAAFEAAPTEGLLLNTRKISSPEDFSEEGFALLEPIPWVKQGYYLPENNYFSKSISYRQGLFYLQDPSAMLPAEVAMARPGEYVLDMCAAPGGKSFRILSDLGEKGFLHANELQEKRAKALSRNIELSGSAIAFITCHNALDLKSLQRDSSVLYDLILLDVPCSGSAMFRKDKRSLSSWRRHRGRELLDLQAALLDEASRHLAPGGRIVYSTCSFSYDENEGQVKRFLADYPEFSLRKFSLPHVDGGLTKGEEDRELAACLRIWPHRAKGEGQFVAVLQCQKKYLEQKIPKIGKQKLGKTADTAFSVFLEENINKSGNFFAECQADKRQIREKENKLHLFPAEFPFSNALYYMKTGLYLGLVRGERDKVQFVPSQALLQHLDLADLKYYLELERGLLMEGALQGQTVTSDHIKQAFLQGEVKSGLSLTDVEALASGTYLVLAFGGRPVLWLKKQESYYKNEYPRSWIS